ncbi:MAG: LiaF domain-containing protein [Ignavibacteriaceae bacterium]
MDENNRTSNPRYVLGIILVLVGGLFLLKSFGIIFLNIPYIIFSWPFFMFVAGVLILVNSRKKPLGIIFISIGGFFLLRRIFDWYDLDFEVIIALAVIALGIYIIFRQRNNSYTADSSSDQSFRNDVIDDVSIFGGGTKIIHSDNFRGGNITAIFGGSEIDLSSCKLAEGTNVIDVVTIFGGAEINVPKDWNVILSVSPIFGGFSNRIRRDPNIPVDLSRSLIIKGVAIFGGGEIKSKF